MSNIYMYFYLQLLTPESSLKQTYFVRSQLCVILSAALNMMYKRNIQRELSEVNSDSFACFTYFKQHCWLSSY